jgi:putative membrane protein
VAYKDFDTHELILRDELALDRTRLANERTLLAYLRTAIMLLVTGGTILEVFGESPVNYVTAWTILGLGGMIAILGFIRFLQVRGTLQRIGRRGS